MNPLDLVQSVLKLRAFYTWHVGYVSCGTGCRNCRIKKKVLGTRRCESGQSLAVWEHPWLADLDVPRLKTSPESSQCLCGHSQRKQGNDGCASPNNKGVTFYPFPWVPRSVLEVFASISLWWGLCCWVPNERPGVKGIGGQVSNSVGQAVGLEWVMRTYNKTYWLLMSKAHCKVFPWLSPHVGRLDGWISWWNRGQAPCCTH